MRWLLASLILVGCAVDPITPDSIAFDVTADTYAPGDFVEYRLSNYSRRQYTYNFCFAVLERAEGDEWVIAGSSESCVGLGAILLPGGSAVGGEELPADLPGGQYRFSMRFTGSAEEQYLTTRTFQVVV